MNPPEDNLSDLTPESRRIIKILSGLPPEERTEAMLRLISMSLEEMPEFAIRDTMDQIRQQFVPMTTTAPWECSVHPVVTTVLELCEGHLALRAIKRMAD